MNCKYLSAGLRNRAVDYGIQEKFHCAGGVHFSDAYGWLMNYSVLRIASEMGIAEGTVRSLIKKVYAKTKISNKGQFMRVFGSSV